MFGFCYCGGVKIFCTRTTRAIRNSLLLPSPRPVLLSGIKKGDIFLADVTTQLKNKNITTDIKFGSDSTLLTTITVGETAPGLKSNFSFKVPDQRSCKVELQCLHDYAGISTSIGLTANPIFNFSGVVGTIVLALGTTRERQ
ncbi:PREDICTED: mitochondrial outer membrane protein porin of 34 kDa-like isoform X2 [Tarenaya hassleriana]|uniref:mitochondrial outer membrane protein porin of 34 kDa-like isoform X2 n=1 Tax=Tarenaya hassleriana TaxID=28532 RepID=UPI00053C5FE7|nr:PREDICTED: mitochondrial outer membrane protein porin of 34 kDa-like isoform X2 [Tarenaya hassleriana]